VNALDKYLTEEKPMFTLMPSMYAGVIGGALTAVLLAADWYIWELRYWVSGQRKTK
jgi:hypothetical protein